MIIERVQSGNATTISPLVAQYWAFEDLGGFQDATVQKHLEQLLSSPALGAVWIATEAQGPVGYLILVYVFSLEHQGLTAEIDELFVVADCRGSGVGSQLLGEAEAEAVRQGCTNISLQVATANPRTRTFYRRHGYSDRSGFELMDKRPCVG